jgi:hypothetical protein
VGFDIRLEDENGNVLDEFGDPKEILQRLLPALDDESFPCLRFVDPYGDTTFNQVQIPFLVQELQTLKLKATSDEEREMLARVQDLARRGCEGPHQYVKFYGD